MSRLTISAFVILIFSFFPWSQGHCGFSLGLSPVRWEAKGKPGKTLRKVIELRCGSRAIQKVKVSKGDWTLNKEGSPVFGKPESMTNSAASWIRFQPETLSIYPRQNKTVRISIKIPENIPAGSYRTALFFEPPDPDKKTKNNAAQVFVRGRLALPIYVTVGDARPSGKILETAWKTMNGKGPVPSLKIQNQGNAHLRMNGIFAAKQLLSGKKFEGIIPALPLLPGQTRWIPLQIQGKTPPTNSDLDLTLQVDLGDGEHEVSVKVLHNNQGA